MSTQIIESDGPELQFRRLVEAITDYAIYMLDPKGNIVSWNAGAERFKGHAAGEILGRHFSAFYTAEDRLSGLPDHALATALAHGRFVDEGWRVRKDGSQFWASVVLEPIHDDDGRLKGFAKVTRDITDKLLLEQAREQLHQAQKMEAVGQLTGGVAHDFNNLLSAVIGCLELIQSGGPDARTGRLVSTAKRAAERGAKLIDQLLAFSRRQVLDPQPSDINAQIAGIETLLSHASGQFIDIAFDLTPDLPPINIDRAQFGSALLNLVINARDAMSRGGTVTVRTHAATLTAADAGRLTEIAAGDYAVVTVNDTGEGMSPEVRARAIEPFYTTKDVGKGTGLGLSQVYGFMRQSGGQLEIVSALGKGTSVSLYIPTLAEATTAADMPLAPPAAVRGRGIVLVVEDDLEVLEVAIEAVHSFGYTVQYARDAAAGQAILDDNPAVDLLFTDVALPDGVSGVELARRARNLRPSIGVLLASGYPRAFLQDREGLLENMAFIPKPYSLSTLSQTLQSLLATPSVARRNEHADAAQSKVA